MSVILGESGAGKTTALWKIIVETSKAIIDGRGSRIPILISLRGWAKDHNCRELVQDQFYLIGAHRDAVERELLRGNCLVLIDGLNELRPDESFRTDAYQELQRFLSRYPKNRFVICCRTADYESRMLGVERLVPSVGRPKVFEIRRMGLDQIVDYVRRYFKEDTGSADELLSKLDVYNEDLWKDQTSIVHLARIPLYLQLFIAEYERSRELPNNQAKLLRTLIYRTLEREKTRQAARIDNYTKERLLSSFAYKSVLEGYWLRVPEYLAREIFQGEVQRFKEQSLIQSEFTVGTVWQEVLSNNFLTATNRQWAEWLHQLICDYFLGCEVVRIWTVGTIAERGKLRTKLTRRTWAQPCAIALGLLDQINGGRFLEHLVGEDQELAQQAFEAQTEEDQRLLAESLILEIIEEGDPETPRLQKLAVKLPSKIIVQILFDKFAVCSKEMEPPIAEAICSLMAEHYPTVDAYRLTGELKYGIEAQRYERLSSAVKRATSILTAWTNNKNELVSFYAAKGLWGAERELAAQTLRRLHRTGSTEAVSLVEELRSDWDIE